MIRANFRELKKLCTFLCTQIKKPYRAIRAEESLRHFILTGKPLDSRLKLGQIIALRLASDEEFPELARQAVDKSMTGKQIKESIRQWRADHHRV